MDLRTYLLILLSGWGVPAAAAAELTAVGPEFQANVYTTAAQTDADVSPDGAGGFVVVWEGDTQDGDGSGVFGRVFDSSGQAAGSEFRISGFSIGNQDDPVVASGATGGFVVTWESRYQDGDQDGIYARLYDSAGLPVGAEFRVNAAVVQDQSDPGLGAAADGSFVVAFEADDADGSRDAVRARCYDADAVPTGLEFQANSYVLDEQADPAVGVAPSGAFVIVWESEAQDGEARGLFGQRYDASCLPVGTEFQVNAYTSGRQADHAVAMTADGGFVVVWEADGQDDSVRSVFARRFDSGGSAMGEEFRVNTYTTGAQDDADVAVGADGWFLIVWASDNGDGAGRGIRGRLYDGDGQARGDDVQVNVHTTGDQGTPDVTASGSDGFVVVWSSDGQDGDGEGVFGRRFVAAPDEPDPVCGDASAVAAPAPRAEITATDALIALQAALGHVQCDPCVCDVDDSGQITTTDALVILQRSVDDEVVLTCPQCE